MSYSLQNLPDFLHALCDAAAKETLPRFRMPIEIHNKEAEGFDPVTEGDRRAEEVIRAQIESSFPDHGIIGEEFDRRNPQAVHQWIIDPIDGTRAFISGVPVWGTLIGLYKDGKPIAGVMDQPFTRERYIAVPAEGSAMVSHLHHASAPSQRLKTRETAELSQATMMTTSPALLDNSKDRGYFELERQVKMVRYGCDCYAYCLVASGNIDLVVESGLNIYDVAALIPIVEGAGGLLTDWQGGDASNGGQVIAAANAELHQQALRVLNA